MPTTNKESNRTIAEECADLHREFPTPAHEGAILVLIKHVEQLYSIVGDLESKVNDL